MCLTEVLKKLMGKGKDAKPDYSKVSSKADEDMWEDENEGWDSWDESGAGGADLESGARPAGGGGGGGAAAGSGGGMPVAAPAPPPAPVTLNPVAAPPMATRAGPRSPRPLQVQMTAASAPTSGASDSPPIRRVSSGRETRKTCYVAAPAPPPAPPATNLFAPKIQAAKRIDPSTAPKTRRIDVDMDDDDFGAGDWDMDDLDVDLDADATAAPAPAPAPSGGRRGRRPRRARTRTEKPKKPAGLGATRLA